MMPITKACLCFAAASDSSPGIVCCRVFLNQPPGVSVRFFATEPGANALRLILNTSFNKPLTR
jgi:hypothetical protein